MTMRVYVNREYQHLTPEDVERGVAAYVAEFEVKPELAWLNPQNQALGGILLDSGIRVEMSGWSPLWELALGPSPEKQTPVESVYEALFPGTEEKEEDEAMAVQVITVTTQKLPITLTPERRMEVAMDLADTVSAIAVETEGQVAMKGQMKAKLSELQARQSRLASVVSTGKEYQDVEVEVRFLDGEHVEEVRKDTGEIVLTRPPRDHERQLFLKPGAVA